MLGDSNGASPFHSKMRGCSQISKTKSTAFFICADDEDRRILEFVTRQFAHLRDLELHLVQRCAAVDRIVHHQDPEIAGIVLDPAMGFAPSHGEAVIAQLQRQQFGRRDKGKVEIKRYQRARRKPAARYADDQVEPVLEAMNIGLDRPVEIVERAEVKFRLISGSFCRPGRSHSALISVSFIGILPSTVLAILSAPGVAVRACSRTNVRGFSSSNIAAYGQPSKDAK